MFNTLKQPATVAGATPSPGSEVESRRAEEAEALASKGTRGSRGERRSKARQDGDDGQGCPTDAEAATRDQQKRAQRAQTIIERLDTLTEAVASRIDLEAAVTELSQRCREFRESSLERDVLNPILRSLINVADHLAEELMRLEDTRDCYTGRGNYVVADELARASEGFKSSITHVQRTLATHGVQPFQNPGVDFDSDTQESVALVPCPQLGVPRRIAKRIRPGYRRAQRVLRPELVHVYAHHQDSIQEKGAKHNAIQ